MQRLSMKKKERRRKKEGKKIGHELDDNLGDEEKNACEVSEREREREMRTGEWRMQIDFIGEKVPAVI